LDSQNAFELLAGLRKQNAKSVIWLDRLPKYLSTSETPLINSLPIILGKYEFRYVLVATCSNLEPDSPVRDRFSDLINRLVIITPADTTREDAQRLVTELAKTGEPIEIEEPFEWTPGSILLAVNKMRDISYARLSQPSKQMLRAVKLLRSAGIRAYTFARLISTLEGVLAFDKTKWDQAYEEVRASGFLRTSISTFGPTPQQRFEPVAEVYFDVAVPDYRDAGDQPSGDWPLFSVLLRPLPTRLV
jgi:hypothetical protein